MERVSSPLHRMRRISFSDLPNISYCRISRPLTMQMMKDHPYQTAGEDLHKTTKIMMTHPCKVKPMLKYLLI